MNQGCFVRQPTINQIFFPTPPYLPNFQVHYKSGYLSFMLAIFVLPIFDPNNFLSHLIVYFPTRWTSSFCITIYYNKEIYLTLPKVPHGVIYVKITLIRTWIGTNVLYYLWNLNFERGPSSLQTSGNPKRKHAEILENSGGGTVKGITNQGTLPHI